MKPGGARCQGEWVGLVAREKGGLSGLGKGLVGMKEGKRAMIKVAAGRMIWNHEEAPNTPKTPPFQQTLKSRPIGCQNCLSGDHHLPSIHSPFIKGPWQTKALGAVASRSRCLRPPRVALQGAAAPQREAQAIPGLHGTFKACCRWLLLRALRSQTLRQNP